MSTTASSPHEHGFVPVDVKKVDYTKNWDSDNVPVIHVIGRAAGGSRVHVKFNHDKPYFYIPEEEYEVGLENEDEVTGIEFGHEDIYGNELAKVHTRIPGDVPRVRDDYKHFEADILFPNRFLIDNDIEDGMLIPREHATNEPTELDIDQVEPISHSEDTRVVFCDIEVDDANGFPDAEDGYQDIVCLTVYDNFTEQYEAFLYHPDTPIITHEESKVRVFSTEAQMLEAFADYLQRVQPDLITGWNFEDFDMRYLVNRFNFLHEDKDRLEYDEDKLSTLGVAYDDGWHGAKVKGIAVFDMYRAYENQQLSELDSFKLEDVAQEELGTGKVKDDRGIREQWQEDPQQLIDYNVKDVKLTVMLEEEQGIIKFYEEVADYVGGRVAECIDPSNAVDQKILRKVHGDFAAPSKGHADSMDFSGGQVFDPITGVRNNVVVLDLKSLYPMSMKTLNAGPKTRVDDGDITAPNGTEFTTEQTAIVVSIIDELLKKREEFKEKRSQYSKGDKLYEIYDRKQYAVKVIMNTLYGVMGWDKFRLADEETGAAVTSTGRSVIKFTEDVVNELGYEVIYGDTDSVMIELDEPDLDPAENQELVDDILHEHNANSLSEFRRTVEESHGEMSDEEFEDYLSILCIGFKFEKEINARYDEFAKEQLNTDEHYFQIEFEKLYRRYFQAGKKKRYAGSIIWKEGECVDDTDIVGFEFKRSDYAEIPRKVQQKVITTIVNGGSFEKVSSIVRSTIENIQNKNFTIEEVGIPSSVPNAFDSYDSKTTAVKGAEYAVEQFDADIQPGDKPKGMYVKRILPNDDGQVEYPMPQRDSNKTQFVCWNKFSTIPDVVQFDWGEYIEKQIKGPVERILEGTDWTWAEVVSGNKQPKLNEYSFEDKSDKSSEPVTVGDQSEDSHGSPSSRSKSKLDEEVMGADELRDALDETQEALDSFDASDFDEDEAEEVLFRELSQDEVSLDTFEAKDVDEDEVQVADCKELEAGDQKLSMFL